MNQLKKWFEGNALWVIGLIGCSIACSFSALMHFHSVNVDITFIQQHASAIEWLKPSSYFSGFHPMLLPVLVKLGGITHWPLIGLLLSNVLYGCCSALIFFVLKKQFNQPFKALITTVLVCSLPQFFEVFVSPMQDSLLVFFILLSVLKFQQGKLLSSGMFMGLSALTRGHGLYIALLFFLFFVLSQHRDFKIWRKWALGVVMFYVPQLIVNLSATGNPFESYQNFNVFQHLHLGHFPSSADLDIPDSILRIALNDPEHFMRTYIELLKKNSLWIAVSLLGVLLGVLKKDRLLLASGVLLTCYLIVAILGNSSRLYAPVILFLAYIIIILLKTVSRSKNAMVWTGSVVVIGLLHFSWMENVSLLLKYRHSQRMTATFTDVMLKEDPATSRKEVFNSHFEYTLEGLAGLAGRARATNWYRYQNLNYNKEFAAPSLEDPASLVHSFCKQQEIKYIVLRQGLLVPDAFERWIQFSGFQIVSSIPQKKFMMSSRYEPLSKEIDTIHLIKVMP